MYRRPERWIRLAVLLVTILIGWGLVLIRLGERSLWADEGATVYQAQRITSLADAAELQTKGHHLLHLSLMMVAVRLIQYPDRLRMTVTDDGRGIPNSTDLRRFVTEGHFGLAGMRERAAMIGGTLDVQSAPDYGTVVILDTPC